jgi:hypothetical protein
MVVRTEEMMMIFSCLLRPRDVMFRLRAVVLMMRIENQLHSSLVLVTSKSIRYIFNICLAKGFITCYL